MPTMSPNVGNVTLRCVTAKVIAEPRGIPAKHAAMMIAAIDQVKLQVTRQTPKQRSKQRK